MGCLRAVDDETNQLAVIATLRSNLFGCDARQLWEWKAAGGSWNPFAPAPIPGPVPRRDGRTRRLDPGDAPGSPPANCSTTSSRPRRALEIATDSPRYRETWRRLRFVVDQARAWSDAERGSLREYLAWATRQAEDHARVVETVLPETRQPLGPPHHHPRLQRPRVPVRRARRALSQEADRAAHRALAAGR